MKSSLVLFLTLLGACLVSSAIVPRFPTPNPVQIGGTQGSAVVNGSVLPCDFDYYNIGTYSNVKPGDYLRIDFNQTGDLSYPTDLGTLYLLRSDYQDLETSLSSGSIIDTLGGLPGPQLFDFECNVDNCTIELSCEFADGTYYLAISGGSYGIISYNFQIFNGSATVYNLTLDLPLAVPEIERPIEPPFARTLTYAFYKLDVPSADFLDGSYFIVNISFASQPLTMRLFFEEIPVNPLDHGVLDTADGGSCIWDYCVDTTYTAGTPYYVYPVSSQPRIPCACTTQEIPYTMENNTEITQLTCNFTVDPCTMQYGNWYISIELPERTNINYFNGGFNQTANQTNNWVSYTLGAYLIQPNITFLENNITTIGFLFPEKTTHFLFYVNASEVAAGQTHLFVEVNNIRGGTVDIWIHQGLNGANDNLAGGNEACFPSNVTCRTDAACNLVVEKCLFTPGNWYIAVTTVSIDDVDRLPISFTLRATYIEDPTPVKLRAGIPVSTFIGEALYDFYVLEVPPTIDTSIRVELYVNANNTEVILSVLNGALPGGECYSRPDFYCVTGDFRGLDFEGGPSVNYTASNNQRESCSFTIDSCYVEQGAVFFSVYGHHRDYLPYQNNTWYQEPVFYTLLVDFETPLPLTSGVSLTQHVHENQYHHYYIRADQIEVGSFLAVEVTNVQHQIPSALQVFVNYNFLAGNCPCFDHIYNCTSVVDSTCPGVTDNHSPSEEFSVNRHCTVVVPPCEFQNGVYYISVLGVSSNLVHHKTPIGYILTATVFAAPSISPLVVGQATPDQVVQFNQTNQYTLYLLNAVPIPNHDLSIKLTYVQSSDFLGKHDNIDFSNLHLFVSLSGAAAAAASCYDYTCTANIDGFSFCTVVIPSCEWNSTSIYIAVQGDYNAPFSARFTLQATVEEVFFTPIYSGIVVNDKVHEYRYRHFGIEIDDSLPDRDLIIEVYTNADQDLVSVFLNPDILAGNRCGYASVQSCSTQSSCFFQLQGCALENTAFYYISVFGESHQFYDAAVEFTIKATYERSAIILTSGAPHTNHIQVGQVQHYHYTYSNPQIAEYITFTIDNVQHGTVQVYSNYGGLAGECPCYQYTSTCSASDVNSTLLENYCEIIIGTCELVTGDYYFSVVGVNNHFPTSVVYATAIGYTAELQLRSSPLYQPNVVLDRFDENVLTGQQIGNNRLNHYQVSISDDQFNAGYHVIVEISNVEGGSLQVYFSDATITGYTALCNTAQICTSGLTEGTECQWQVPYCLATAGNHYITVAAATGRTFASYDIVVYFDGPILALPQNPTFTLDDIQASAAFLPTGSNLTIIHDDNQEPFGWVKFIQLQDVTITDTEGGEILEVFFYAVQNNAGEPLAFEVYLWPEAPAGAHGCCSDGLTEAEVGSCENAPCLRTAPTTIFYPGFIGAPSTGSPASVFGSPSAHNDNTENHLCFPSQTGEGSDPTDGLSPFFGDRCTVRVWACDLHRLQTVQTVNWWMSVVPLAPPNPDNSPLNGLTYTMQWRVRNVRTDPTTNSIGSVDLSPIVNLQEDPYTSQAYTVTTPTTEAEAFGSFYIDFNITDTSVHQFTIQTQIINGTAEVYIANDMFANPLDCYTYYCNSTYDCFDVDRFVVPPCVAKSTRYYITVRNLGGAGSSTSFRFRAVDILHTNVTSINADLVQSFPFVAQSRNGLGLQGENYDFYSINLRDENIDAGQSLIINTTKLGYPGQPLNILVRYGSPAGDASQGCYSFQHNCTINQNGETCLIQLQGCDLIAGPWFITIYNPTFDAYGGQDNFLDYQMEVFFQQTRNITLGVDLVDFYFPYATAYVEYRLIVKPSDIQYLNYTSGGASSYFVDFIRVFVYNVTTNGNVNVFVNYGVPAGNALDSQCLGGTEIVACNNVTDVCYFDILPCGAAATNSSVVPTNLASGIYYIGLEVTGEAIYQINATVYTSTYEQITTSQNVTGTDHRNGTSNVIYTLENSGQQQQQQQGLNSTDGIFRYFLNISDVSDQRSYVIINISATDNTTTLIDTIELTVWRGCATYHCNITANNTLGWCTIDALGLAPCSVESGVYYFRVNNPSLAPFTITIYENQTTTQTIYNNQTITDVIYTYEYQAYYFEAFDVGFASTFVATINSICGTLEAWINPDYIGGPTADFSTAVNSCSLFHCVGTPDSPCILTLDTCEYNQRGYWITIRGNAQTFPAQFNPNLYLPVRYNISVLQTQIELVEIVKNQPVLIDYAETLNQQPRVFYLDLENVFANSVVRIGLALPHGVDQTFLGGSLYVSTQNPDFGYTPQCAYEYSCSIDTSTSCVIEIYICNENANRYYLFPDAPRGSVLLVQVDEVPIKVLTTGALYSATINAPFLDISSGFDNHASQLYRYDLNPNQLVDFFFTVTVSNVTNGIVQLSLFYSENPSYVSSGICGYNTTYSCSASAGSDCFLSLSNCDITAFYDFYASIQPFSVFISVSGTQLSTNCPESTSSIGYNLLVEDQAAAIPFEIGETLCQTVTEGDFNFYRLYPGSTARPQDVILQVTITNLTPGKTLQFNFADRSGHATNDCNAFANLITGNFSRQIVCGYDAAQFSIYGGEGISSSFDVYGNVYTTGYLTSYGSEIEYSISITEVSVKTVQLYQNVPYSVDDNVADACLHQYDFFYFRTGQRNQHGYVRFTLQSDFVLIAWANRQYFGGPECYDVGACTNVISPTASCTILDVCHDVVLDYYVTVESLGPYMITAFYEYLVKNMTLNQSLSDSIALGDAHLYALNISNASPGQRLVVQIEGLEYGSIAAYIDYESQPGPSFTATTIGYCGLSSIYLSPAPYTTNYGALVVDSCDFQVGIYYITVVAYNSFFAGDLNITYTLNTVIEDLTINTTSLTINTVLHGQSINYYPIDIQTNPYTKIQYFAVRGNYLNTTALGTVRLVDVQGGVLRAFVSEKYLVTPGKIYDYGNVESLYTSTSIFSGLFNQTLVNDFYQATETNDCSSSASCSLGCCVTKDGNSSSCAISLDPCSWGTEFYYIAVEALYQYELGTPITYGIVVEDYKKYELISSNTAVTGNFTNGNYDYHYYSGLSNGQESIRVRTQVINGDNVIVTVANHQCLDNATWVQQVDCSGRYYDNPWQCDISINTKGLYPAIDEYFYITVYGSNATYSLSFYSGLANCERFNETGVRHGLSFCAGIIDYTTATWYNFTRLDAAAEYLFYDLYNNFHVQPCWTGTTQECNATLQRFACYENFHRCDNNGFSVGTCRRACNAVVYECFNWFESVSLPQLNCTSDRYLDEYQICTGHGESAFFDYPNYPFKPFPNPNDIIFDWTIPQNDGSSLKAPLMMVFASLLTFFLYFVN